MKYKKTLPSHHSIDLAGIIVEREGKLETKLNAPHLMRHFLKTYCKPGDYFSIKLTNKRPKRTVSQNNFYHLYLSLVSQSSGHTIAELKQWVKGKFLTKGITEVFGDKVRVVDSSSDLNISEFAELMNQIEIATGVPIPDPAPFNIPLTFNEYRRLKVAQDEKYSRIKAKKLRIKK